MSRGQVVDAFSFGLNWSLTSAFALNVNYRDLELDKAGVRNGADGIMGWIILALE